MTVQQVKVRYTGAVPLVRTEAGDFRPGEERDVPAPLAERLCAQRTWERVEESKPKPVKKAKARKEND